MTTSTAPTTPAAAAQPTTAHRVSGRQTLPHALHAEWIKLISLRSTWITSAIALFLTTSFGAGIAILLSRENDSRAWSSLVSGTTFGEITVAVLGALIITGEYSSGQIRSTAAAVPRRGRAFTAKALMAALWSFALGMVSMLLAWLIATPFMGDYAPSFSDSQHLGIIWGTGLAFAAITLMSLGYGYLMRSTAGTITVVAVLLFIINIPVSLMAVKWDWAQDILEVLPATSVTALVSPLDNSAWKDANPDMFLTHTNAMLVVGLWVLVPFVAGLLLYRHRDI